MSLNIKIKAIKPKNKNFLSDIAKQVSRDLIKVADIAASGIQSDFQATVVTWNTKPEFVIIKDGANRIIQTTNEIYFYIDKGTKVRYAIMSKDFLAKSQPRVLGSRIGRGGVVFISKKHPMPGIEARQFDEVISQKWQPLYTSVVQGIISQAVKTQKH